MSIKLRFSVTCILYRRKLPDIMQVLNVYVILIKFLQNASFLRKLNPLNFALIYWKFHFLDHFNLWKSTPLKRMFFFFLARTYLARIQLSFTNTRGIQYSPYVNHCVSPYRDLNLTLETKYKLQMNIKIGILNVPKHGNKHDLIHFVTDIKICFCVSGKTDKKTWRNDIYFIIISTIVSYQIVYIGLRQL